MAERWLRCAAETAKGAAKKSISRRRNASRSPLEAKLQKERRELVSPSRPLGFSLLRQDMTPEERAKAAEVHH
jgi:hypothetical protein